MKNINTKIKDFWNNCNPVFSHNEIKDYLGNEDKLCNFWENNFINKINFKNKRVLDYGIGGGYLGKYLLSKKDIKYYIGVDISERSLKKADLILQKYSKRYKLLNCYSFYGDFNEKVDIIVCQACIQHFYNERYLIDFLEKTNKLNSNTIMLQIAYNHETEFNNSEYNAMSNVRRACYCNKEFILKYLTNYNIDYHSKIAKNNYQFLIFTQK